MLLRFLLYGLPRHRHFIFRLPLAASGEFTQSWAPSFAHLSTWLQSMRWTLLVTFTNISFQIIFYYALTILRNNRSITRFQIYMYKANHSFTFTKNDTNSWQNVISVIWDRLGKKLLVAFTTPRTIFIFVACLFTECGQLYDRYISSVLLLLVSS